MALLKVNHIEKEQSDIKEVVKETRKMANSIEIMALEIRQGIRPEDMQQMSFVSLMNILISAVEEKDTTRKASKEDIERFVGGI